MRFEHGKLMMVVEIKSFKPTRTIILSITNTMTGDERYVELNESQARKVHAKLGDAINDIAKFSGT